MKKLFVLLLCVLITVSAVLPLSAEYDKGTALVYDLLKYYRYETEQIALAVKDQRENWDTYLGAEPEEVMYDYMYQVYYLNMKDIVGAYDTDGSFGANITNKYYWVVPNYTRGCEVQVVRNQDTEYGWAIRRGTRYMSSIAQSYDGTVFGIEAIYDNVLNKCPEVSKDSFKLVYDDLNDMHLMYFIAAGQEYVVPYFASADINWIKNEEVYTAKDFVELIRTNTGDDTSNIELDTGKFDTETIYLNYIVVGTLAVMGIAAVAVIVAKKKDKNN